MNPLLNYELPQHLLIVGCGDIGLRVATRLHAMGREVTGVVRSQQSADALRRTHIQALHCDLDDFVSTVPSAECVFYFVAPQTSGVEDLRLRRYLSALNKPPQRLIYISTSGVYGDCHGNWIDEDAPLQPKSDRGKRRLDAERALADFSVRSTCAVITLRVPGIYGPGRLPVKRLREGLPVLRESECPYTNRIHADDLAAAAILASQKGIAGRAYNISDGAPTTMSDYFKRCAALLNLPMPPEISMVEAQDTMTSAMLSFLEESKRLLTHRARAEFGFTPRYSTLAAGLPSCIASD